MIVIITLFIIFLDQATKFLASQNLTLAQPVPVVKGVLSLTLVHNRGAAFGILKNQVPFFIFAALVATVLICVNLNKSQRDEPAVYNISLSLILAGGLGNLIDRIWLGYVIDFIDFGFWPVFNVADSAITAGALLLGWTIMTAESMQAKQKKG